MTVTIYGESFLDCVRGERIPQWGFWERRDIQMAGESLHLSSFAPQVQCRLARGKRAPRVPPRVESQDESRTLKACSRIIVCRRLIPQITLVVLHFITREKLSKLTLEGNPFVMRLLSPNVSDNLSSLRSPDRKRSKTLLPVELCKLARLALQPF